MPEQRKAIVGFHSEFGNEIANAFKRGGYAVTQVFDLEYMLEAMGLPKDVKEDSKPTVHFDYYVMDTNLGTPNGRTCEPSARVYGYIKREVEENRIRFMSFTANNYARSLAEESGIPVTDKADLDKLDEFYMKIEGS